MPASSFPYYARRSLAIVGGTRSSGPLFTNLVHHVRAKGIAEAIAASWAVRGFVCHLTPHTYE
jgi:hypothetical protein